jgi:hypothetical protein
MFLAFHKYFSCISSKITAGNLGFLIPSNRAVFMKHLMHCATILAGFILLIHGQIGLSQTPEDLGGDDIQIVTGETRTVYEYRQNGKLVAIKVVPKDGRPYYMVPADETGMPRDLETARHLYPQWVIVEW